MIAAAHAVSARLPPKQRAFLVAQRIDPLPIAVLISGGGTTLRNLIEKIERRIVAR